MMPLRVLFSLLALLCLGCDSDGESFVTDEESLAQGDGPGLIDLSEEESEGTSSSGSDGGEETASEEAEADAASSDPPEEETEVEEEEPQPSCTEGADCDDGLDCTEDVCVDGVCSWTLQEDTCLIGNVCYEAGQGGPLLVCEVCNPEINDTEWSPAEEGASCDDGNACTSDDVCTADGCEGEPLQCDSTDSPCTALSCDPAIGCVEGAVNDNGACDDGNACTSDDTCLAGLCLGAPVMCNDGEQCTEDSCDPESGCLFNWTLNAACEDGNPCTGGDVCGEEGCLSGDGDGCDDLNGCTIDLCEEGFGCGNIPIQSPCCLGEVSVCDDGNACTLDSCDPDTQDCSYEVIADGVACDDGDACTSEELCGGGECLGVQKDCSDGNSCTDDLCDPDTGSCSQVELSGVPCDDGLPCSIGDACQAGQCVADTSECSCGPASFGDATKISALNIGSGGVPGQGLDVDGDPGTCSPSSDCTDGVDNAFSLMGAFMNEELLASLTSGEVILVTEFVNGGSTLLFHQGELAPTNLNCDFMAETCDYEVDILGYDPDSCEPIVSMDVVIDGTFISAGGPGTILPFQVPLPGASLELPIYNVKFEGELTYQGDEIVGIAGVMGGAIEKTALLASIDALPEEGLPVPKDAIKSILELTLEYDMDTNGDGTKDGASIGFPFVAIDANISGVSE